MRSHYPFNPTTGQWFLGSFMLSPTLVEQFIKDNKLEGFQVIGVDMIDVFWLRTKTAIDNRNNNAQIAFQEELIAQARKASNALSQVAAQQAEEAIAGQDAVVVPVGTIAGGEVVVSPLTAEQKAAIEQEAAATIAAANAGQAKAPVTALSLKEKLAANKK